MPPAAEQLDRISVWLTVHVEYRPGARGGDNNSERLTLRLHCGTDLALLALAALRCPRAQPWICSGVAEGSAAAAAAGRLRRAPGTDGVRGDGTGAVPCRAALACST